MALSSVPEVCLVPIPPPPSGEEPEEQTPPGQVVGADEARPLLGRVVQDVAVVAPQRYLFGHGREGAVQLRPTFNANNSAAISVQCYFGRHQ